MTEEELVKLLMENPEKIHKMIWNIAIEAAIKVGLQYSGIETAEQIRKLRK